ncbi:putative methyl-accepting chemotaxis sensory transducer [Mycobacteroides abscessus subsp. massiliense]|nr:putative methyl-accepting chemotaxis sensory transducer [Mycobacteroides abscessus subsp. massiliense]SKT98771.1 putative methyl-accepting chemotaxis sensory transducer [Mycobacteroides abscessus subsp. massiliense]
MPAKPSGEYEDRMLQGAWPDTKPEDRYSLQREIARRADHTRDQHSELRANAHQLKEVLQSDGFDALHEDRAKTDRNYSLFYDEQRSLHDWTGRSGDLISAIQSKMAADVHTAMGMIKAIEADPLLEESEKEEARETIIRETNARLIAENVAAGKIASGDFARHMALAESLPYYMSKADPTPYAPTQSNSGASMMKFSKGPPLPGKGGDGDLPGKGDSPGKNTENKLPTKSSEPGQAPGKAKEPSLPESKKPGVGSAAGKGLEPKLPTSESPTPSGTSSSTTSSPLGVPGGGGSGGGVPGSGGAGSPTSALGGLGNVARGAPLSPGNLTPANPAASNPLASATPAAASALSSGGGARPTVPASPMQAAPVSANPQSPVMPPQSGAAQVVPAGNTSANAPQTVTAAPQGPVQGPLGQAPPLSGAPPPPAGATTPSPTPGMSGAQGGVTAGPAGAPLPTGVPVVGTPLVRNGILEKAEDPDLAFARDLIFQLLWASRRYPSLDWAIGIHRIGDETTFFMTSSEGLCYIPAHVFLPAMPGLVPLFHDVQVDRPTWSVLWQGWADPARPVAQHHRLRAELYGSDALYAIVSSRPIDDNIQHVIPQGTVLEFCDPDKNQYINPDKAHLVAELAPGQLHRMAVASPDLWALATQVPASERWSAAVDLVSDSVLATNFRQVQTGVVYSDEPVPVNDPYSDALNHVLGPIHSGMDVDINAWQRLNMAYYTHLMQAQSARHTTHDLTDDTGYVDMYRRARAYEAAQLLNQPPGPLPDTWLADIAYCHFAATANVQRTGDLMYRRLAAQPA